MSVDKKVGDEAPPAVSALHPCFEFDHDLMLVKIDITLPATTAAITPAVDTIMENVRKNDCAAGKEFEIETALREALANAIKHGCHNDPTQQVRCCVACEDNGSMLIIVRDPGPGFDPVSIPDCTMGENLLENHGRGIYLINELMDEVTFARNGTEIHMRKY